MSADVRIREALVSAPHGHVDMDRLLGDVQRRAKVKRRRRRFAASATCIVLLFGAATAVVYANGSDGRGPAVSLQPASPDDAPVALPRFLPDASMTIDRIDLSGPYPPQTAYAQIFAANPTLEGPRLSIVTWPLNPADKGGPSCGATSGLSRKPEDYGAPIVIGDHNACLYTVAEPSIEWVDPDGVSVSIQSSGLSSDEVIQVAKSVERNGDHEGVTLNAPLPAGLSEVMRGAGPSHSPTEVIFHHGTCEYVLGVNQTNPLAFAEAGTITAVSGHAALLHENWLGWNPVAGATVGLIVNESGVDATTAVADCDPVGVASTVRQVDNATWDQTLTDLGDRVNRPGQATTTTPAPALDTPQPQYQGEEAAIANVFTTWISGPGVDATVPLIEDGDALRATLSQVPAGSANAQKHAARVDAITLVDDTHAHVTFSIVDENSNVVLGNQQGAAVKIDGTWRVSRATYCALVSRGGIQCPPG
jgi:hypothetical protein